MAHLPFCFMFELDRIAVGCRSFTVRFLEEQCVNSTANRRIMRSPGSEAMPAVIPGRIERCEPGISRFSDVQLHIVVRCGACHRAALCADPLASPRNDAGGSHRGD